MPPRDDRAAAAHSSAASTDAPAVIFERLRLRGFGRHVDTTLTFPAGIVTTIAGNERGKSTALLGLVATIWGLPHGGERDGFTWSRFRASTGAPHRGEVDFRVGDVRFRLERDFETHRVRIVRGDDGAAEEILDAEHNPLARRGHGRVPAWLRATFGIDDAALVLATFVLAADSLAGSGDAIAPSVQALLTGAGGGTAQEAIERLETDLRRITRRVRGLTPNLQRDGREERLLELAQERRRTLEGALRGAFASLDERTRARLGHDAAVAAAEQAAAAAAAAERAAVAVAAADAAEAAARAANERATDATRALDAAWRSAAALATARAAAAATHPELAFVTDPTWDERIAAVASAEEAVAEQQRRLAAATEQRARLLADAGARVAELLERTRAIERATVDVDDDPWAAWRAAVTAAERWRAALAQASAERDRAAELAAALRAYAPLEALDEGERAAARGYRADLIAFAERLAASRAEADVAAARLAEVDLRYGPVAELDAATIEDLHAFVRAEDRRESGAAAAFLAALVVAGGVVVAGVWWWDLGVPLLAGAAFAAVVTFVAWPRGTALRRAERRLLARVAAGVQVLEGGADRYRELWRRREAFEIRRDEVARIRSEAIEAQARQREVEAAAAAFRARWEPLRDALLAAGHGEDVDVGAAMEQHERLRAAWEAAEAAATAALAAVGIDEASAPFATPARDAGADAALLLAWSATRGGLGADATVEELRAWLAAHDDAAWRAWGEADALAVAERAAARAALARLEEDVTRMAREQERSVLAEEAALAQAVERWEAARAAALAGAEPGVAAFDAAAFDAAALRAAARARTQAEAAVAAAAARLQAHLSALGVADVAALEGRAAREALQAARASEAAAAATSTAAAAAAEARDRVAALAAEEGEEGGDGDAFGRDPLVARSARAAAATAARVAAAREALLRAEFAEPLDPAQIEGELQAVSVDLARLTFERDARALAARVLGSAAERHRLAHARALEGAASRAFAAFTGVAGRRVRLGADVRAEVIEPDGRVWVAGQLSQGARDQLTLALRIAVAEVLAGRIRPPLLLDDPFAHWDRGRLAAARAALEALAAEGRQVWLLAHRPEFASWGTAAGVEVG
jgi:chromosome segregation protein